MPNRIQKHIDAQLARPVVCPDTGEGFSSIREAIGSMRQIGFEITLRDVLRAIEKGTVMADRYWDWK